MQFTMRKKIFRLQANEKSFAAERFSVVLRTIFQRGRMSGKGWNGGRKSPFFPLFGDRKMSSSVCRFAMITLRMLTGFHGDVDGWACQMSE